MEDIATNSPTRKEVMSPEELAEYLGCGRTYAYQLLAKGAEGDGIRSFKLGRLRKVLRSDANEFIGRRLADAEQEHRAK